MSWLKLVGEAKDISMNLPNNFDRLSVVKAVGLHLFPGVLALGFYFLVWPLVKNYGLPAAYAYFSTTLLILVPAELGYLLYQGLRNGVGLKRTIIYREPLPLWQYAIFVVFFFLWTVFAFYVAARPISEFLFQNIFRDFSDWFYYPATASGTGGSTIFLVVTWLLDLLLAGLVNPVVHELYFRGHLLPRISHLGPVAPVINALLFAFSRFFYAPWLTPARFLAFLPLAYITWRKKNVFVAIFAHIAIDNIPIFLFFFR